MNPEYERWRRQQEISRVLTARQNDVLKLVANGKCNKEIAEELNISIRTVKFHVSNLLAIYRVRTRFEMAMVAKGVA